MIRPRKVLKADEPCSGEQIGVKDSNLLESAVPRPQSSAFGDDAYPTVYEKAAAIFQSVGQNRPFQNGTDLS
ncbi:Fic family protein [Paenibacillus silvae]|uniref:Fic family protein n=1 Tax=Paenibacillus silvae TaxID=1325358 RepID=UPI003CF85DD1